MVATVETSQFFEQRVVGSKTYEEEQCREGSTKVMSVANSTL
jgi:hypothetical protein